ncbi:hypothetical protein A2313_01320 [Candidatus Roizmanbacteria bacterium RIFOXYB2_FULL_41_10]|uniref:Bacteriophage T5 Orf172 DNA-binding domain-containing protein n=1 Tax=Candidatus Roizmanbacteria bacterium RIFOXYA1_FULL_41_12 TaxID=1802082 RepID=A0A1F7K935_9BACT|nr:MAG: hypothetical protein A2209_02535 [Candidatus Roizmanbacteria bacterium RIFOXYA1_FULL_41_12]OGK67620.1 MAG: hypothetical protein A2377_00605 [Candidatus Roizmanbacteria bacterium RIFOXYB1_FULL_41_27]OGK68496.1 MAG: hypothetical protein A2262_01025 [Candidatus Roizmanbacteria bacterium RIFOXYA2_FULL_41_8]OGK71020.1 MAG: hypothetical protein A2313_01320 [Candidatus Roizmanbacteria bacterium RIFOXYB2_FULL_41_10]OGK71342.1 MAG: hypothetical protein A2403_00990 [Candidatus Roizmanbacteria bac
MSNITKQDILEAIRRTAKENGGKPLGIGGFEKETGIKKYDWLKYWSRFGDVLLEAGFTPNQFGFVYTDDFLIEKIIIVIRRLGKFPTYQELTVERNNNPELPIFSVFIRAFGSKKRFAKKVIEYCQSKNGYEDIIKLCDAVSEKTGKKEDSDDRSKEVLGAVYLFKHGKYYKIGKTNDTVRRGNELKIQLPENLDLIHEIKTDDPSGIEAYWHKRFETKRKNGEWFDLNSTDIKAFKCWRRII